MNGEFVRNANLGVNCDLYDGHTAYLILTNCDLLPMIYSNIVNRYLRREA